MLGYLIQHAQFGEGRVIANEAGSITVRFFIPPSEQLEKDFGSDALKRGFLQRLRLERGRVCLGPRGSCVVTQLLNGEHASLRTYEVRYDDGSSSTTSEAELEPKNSSTHSRPSARLAIRDIEGLTAFNSREALRIAQLQNLRQAGKLVALLSARVDLLPHQAFVAGSVLDDRRRRYILADEVGLGKTVEAGIIIHDLLLSNSSARVLIICPGVLTQQWFCEIYSKFGGQIFTLFDLHDESSFDWSSASRLIISMSHILGAAGMELAKTDWDLVIVDECHHLLAIPTLYSLVKHLARRSQSLLLLSAIPARRKGNELLRLLSLLEPERFDSEQTDSVAEFEALYEAQTQLNRRLRPLIIRLKGLESGEYTVDDVQRQVQRLLELPVLANDNDLANAKRGMEQSPNQTASIAAKIVDHVADRYRIYRRMLRNRRRALIQEGKLEPIDRICDIRSYVPGQREADALAAVDYLLSEAFTSGRETELVTIIARLVWQSLASSDCALEFLRPILAVSAGTLNPQGRAFLSLGHLRGYDDWQLYKDLAQRVAANLLPRDLLSEAISSLTHWDESSENETRFRYSLGILREVQKENNRTKILLFAGYPGLAEEVAARLRDEVGREVVSEFRTEMTREAKENSVYRFQYDPRVTILVSDETGGEGRNFQFADAIMHYDQPWQVGRVEQRIGRLDRIGRNRYRRDVLSLVACAKGSLEEALVCCYDKGFGVYRDSISGLEFSLHDQEERLARAALVDGIDGLFTCTNDLRAVAVDERARDDNDAILDWASFQESRVQRYLSVRTKPETEQYLQKSFVNYFQELAGKHSATKFSDDKTRDGLWAFLPEAVRVSNVVPTRLSGKNIGTFRRDIAQGRLDREFFQVGNPLFDGIIAACVTHPFARTYAIDSRSSELAPWAGFEFVFSAQPNVCALGASRELAQLVTSYFWIAPVHIFIGLNGHLEKDAQAIRSFRQSLTKENKDRAWVDLSKNREILLDSFLKAHDWSEKVEEFSVRAEQTAKGILSERLDSTIGEISSRWEMLVQKTRERVTAITSQEASKLTSAIQAIQGWTVQQEGAGFLAINQNLAGVR